MRPYLPVWGAIVVLLQDANSPVPFGGRQQRSVRYLEGLDALATLMTRHAEERHRHAVEVDKLETDMRAALRDHYLQGIRDAGKSLK